jgi:hypothetical protein
MLPAQCPRRHKTKAGRRPRRRPAKVVPDAMAEPSSGVDDRAGFRTGASRCWRPRSRRAKRRDTSHNRSGAWSGRIRTAVISGPSSLQTFWLGFAHAPKRSCETRDLGASIPPPEGGFASTTRGWLPDVRASTQPYSTIRRWQRPAGLESHARYGRIRGLRPQAYSGNAVRGVSSHRASR